MRRSFDSASLAQDDSIFEMFEPVRQALHLSVRLQITQVFSLNRNFFGILRTCVLVSTNPIDASGDTVHYDPVPALLNLHQPLQVVHLLLEAFVLLFQATKHGNPICAVGLSENFMLTFSENLCTMP